MSPFRHFVAASLVLTCSCGLVAQNVKTWASRLEARGIRVSAGLWDLKTGKLAESFQSDRALTPASTTKVVSTYALLKSLKPDSVLETEVWGDLQGDGTVVGDLIFKGAGDPLLTSERLWALAQELKNKGVQRVTGGIRLDQSAFDGQLYGPGWENTSANTTPPILPLSVNFNRDGAGRIVQDPATLAVETLSRILREAGILFGAANERRAGEAQKLLAFPSPPLRSLVQDINKYSNNFMVEMLVKRFGGGSWPGGIKRIQDFYREVLHLGAEQIAITDASGLSKENRLSARTLSTVLRAAWHDFEVGPEMIASLKVIGGEPWRLHIKDPNLARRVRVKTGHLSGVWSACGYLQRPDGQLRVFAIILNGNRATEEDVWEMLSRWAN